MLFPNMEIKWKMSNLSIFEKIDYIKCILRKKYYVIVHFENYFYSSTYHDIEKHLNISMN